jgi:hypothetical protein
MLHALHGEGKSPVKIPERDLPMPEEFKPYDNHQNK